MCEATHRSRRPGYNPVNMPDPIRKRFGYYVLGVTCRDTNRSEIVTRESLVVTSAAVKYSQRESLVVTSAAVKYSQRESLVVSCKDCVYYRPTRP